jgi:recombination protein RecT
MASYASENPVSAAKRVRAERIDEIFRGQWKALLAIFPENGKERAARARATARSVSQALDVNVTAESIAEAALACHHLGLEVGDQAYIYPFKGRAQLTVGPRGLIALAYQSGFVKSIKACSVFRGDDFAYDLGDDSIHHVKGENRRIGEHDERGEVRRVKPEKLITHAWAKIETRTEGRILEVLTAEDLGYYRGFSKASSGPWFDNFEGMARKTALKRVLEFVPRSPLLSAALAETEDGTYAVPEELAEIVERAIAKRDGRPMPADAEERPSGIELPSERGDAPARAAGSEAS